MVAPVTTGRHLVRRAPRREPTVRRPLRSAASGVDISAVRGLLDSPQDLLTARALEKYGFSLLP